MNIDKLLYRLPTALFALFAALGLVNPAHAYDVYRSVAANPGTGAVTWTVANFGVSGHPPTLSFFHFANDGAAQQRFPAAQCFVKVNLANTAPNPLPNAQDTVGNAAIAIVGANPVDQPQPFPWTIVFDNNPAGHWSIARAEMSALGPNAPAGRVAAAGFHTLAVHAGGAGVTVINGTLGHCHA
jgi:hypothetical protein